MYHPNILVYKLILISTFVERENAGFPNGISKLQNFTKKYEEMKIIEV